MPRSMPASRYLDTGDFYGMGHNEMLLREALKGGRRDKAFIAVKFGSMRDPYWRALGDDVRPQAAKNFLAYSLKRLGTDYVDLYMPARVSHDGADRGTVGAIAEMVQAGFVRHIGLSEAGVGSIRRAQKVHPIVALQMEYSLMSRGIEREILPALRELGIAVTAYGVLSRGLISRTARASQHQGEIRSRMPRFADGNFERNLALVDALAEIAAEKGISVAQLAIAWVRSRGDDIMPLIGARRRDQLNEALAAADLKLAPRTISPVSRRRCRRMRSPGPGVRRGHGASRFRDTRIRPGRAAVQILVVGAGVIGLAVARAAALAGHEVIVAEAANGIGTGISSRNSEVIHAGLYYPTGSVRACTACAGGACCTTTVPRTAWPRRKCGKLLVATDEQELAKVESIRGAGDANGVEGLEMIGGNAACVLEPELWCIGALLSPETGIVDGHGFMLALRGDLEDHGGMIAFEDADRAHGVQVRPVARAVRRCRARTISKSMR